jgi:hypothetical protein
MSDLKLTSEQIDYILSPSAIRASSRRIYDYVQAGKSYFKIDDSKLKPTIGYVLEVIKKNYPDLNIPFHSRWGHFRVGQIDRVKDLDAKLISFDQKEKARIKLDLAITSVLLDAGAGPKWSYVEKPSDKTFSRSEGLGVASFHLFLSGAMSSDRKSWKADIQGLKNLSRTDITNYFQVTESNPLLGVDGRLQLLNNLAKALENKEIFKNGRPGNILDYLIEKHGSVVPATAILRAVLDGLGPIWPGRLSVGSINLGDVWKHSKLSSNEMESLVAFHKLSQWMTYSLIEPIMDAGIEVTGVEKLTGLAEYRNGGLLVDSGLLVVKDPKNLEQSWTPDSDFIIEWRALTVYFLDIIGAEIQKALGKTPQDFPLAKVLEGGTWWAGRFIAKEKRANGEPPVQIKSDGTVF